MPIEIKCIVLAFAFVGQSMDIKTILLLVLWYFLRYGLRLLLDQCHCSAYTTHYDASVPLHVKVLLIPMMAKKR